VWFERISISSVDGLWIPLEDFVASGVRWWDALYARDARTSGTGIFPLDD